MEYKDISETSEKLIEKAMTGEYSYSELIENLYNAVEFFQENYYESKGWKVHRETVIEKINELLAVRKEYFLVGNIGSEYKLAKKQIKALEGLLL